MLTMRLFVDFIPVLVWALLGAVLVIVMLFASWVLRPHVLQNSEKLSTYECGEEPIGPARISYPYNYYLYAVLFVIVDVMGAFLWLLATSSLRFELPVVTQTLIFILIVMGGIGFVMKVMPDTFLSSEETLDLWREAKAAEESQIEHKGGQ